MVDMRKIARSALEAAKGFDLYPESEPYVEFSSRASQAATWVTVVLICFAGIDASLKIDQVQHRTMDSNFQRAQPNEAFSLPALAIFPSGRMEEAPFAFNESWYRVLFNRVEWGQSGNKIKTRVNLGGQKALINLGGQKMEVWTLDEHMASNTTIQGQFADEIFSYVEVVVQPCYAYEDELRNATNRRCAPKKDIDAFFCTSEDYCSNNYNTLGVYLSNRQTLTYTKWDSLFYINLEPQMWIGVEMILRAVSAHIVGIWGVWSISKPENSTWLKFQDWYTRKSSTAGDKEKEIMKIYIKIDGTLVEQVYTEYGFEAFIGRVGSYWAFLGISVGLLASIVNKWISCCVKSERDGLELRVARRHRDLLGLQISQQSLRNLKATIISGKGGRRTSLRTLSGKIPSFPAEIQIKPTHFDVWNDNDVAEQPVRVEPLSLSKSASDQKVPIEQQNVVDHDRVVSRARWVDKLSSMENEIARIRQQMSGSTARVTHFDLRNFTVP
jgi:hypothetical protein